MLREGKCVICGRSFMYDRGKKITCSEECAIKRNRIRSAEYKAEQRKKPKVPRKKKVKANLNKDLKEARKLGLSYGMYMAVMHGGMAVERGEEDGKIN